MVRKGMLVAGLLLISTGLAAAGPGQTTASLKLRAGPGTNFGVLTSMPPGAAVDVLGCGPDGWCRVMFAGLTGYASASYLNVGGPGAVAAAPVVVAPAAVVVAPAPVIVTRPYYRRYGYRYGWHRW
jgi:uncharacterized protein YraI